MAACTDAAAVPAVGLALKRALGSIHVQLIDPGDITICKREDGSDWLLGAGSFGKVTTRHCRVSHHMPLLLPAAGLQTGHEILCSWTIGRLSRSSVLTT